MSKAKSKASKNQRRDSKGRFASGGGFGKTAKKIAKRVGAATAVAAAVNIGAGIMVNRAIKKSRGKDSGSWL